MSAELPPPSPSRRADPGAIDESRESEFVIHPDGRVFAFGITREVVAVLGSLPSTRGPGRRALDRIRDRLEGAPHDPE